MWCFVVVSGIIGWEWGQCSLACEISWKIPTATPATDIASPSPARHYLSPICKQSKALADFWNCFRSCAALLVSSSSSLDPSPPSSPTSSSPPSLAASTPSPSSPVTVSVPKSPSQSRPSSRPTTSPSSGSRSRCLVSLMALAAPKMLSASPSPP